MRDYIQVPQPQPGRTVSPTYGQPDNTQPPKFHTSSNRDYSGTHDTYPEATNLFKGTARLAQRAAGVIGIEIGAEKLVEDLEHHIDGPQSSLNPNPSAYERATTGDSNNAEFLRREKNKGDWFDDIVRRSRPQRGGDATTESGVATQSGLPSRSGMQPDLASKSPQVRARAWRGPDAIDTQTALPAGPTGVSEYSQQAPIQATYKRPEPLALPPGPQTPVTSSRAQRRSQSPIGNTLPGVDWSKF